jgi:deoxyguanosine kinase
MQTPFITVEGPIGVGKTSLAKKITENFSYHFLGEIVDENPFLAKFYTDIHEWSFQTEMFFLSNRYKQLEDIQKDFLSKEMPVVADYHIMKNLIFASRSLNDNQLAKYQQIYSILTHDMPKPNVMIYLRASLETLKKRIAMRGRDFEEAITEEYLLNLIHDYDQTINQFKQTHPEIPVIIYNADEIDFIKRPEDLQMIQRDLYNILPKGDN